ncbi:MAG: hypothetical protein HY873_03445 [Chloroflexi bacterium]|nr:hypothetical protein [Chloroflexota bacterium]
MEFTPIKGRRVPLPPGHVAAKLPPELWQPYKRLHAQYQAYLSGMPMLAERDFDGKRSVKMTPKQLRALNAAFGALFESGTGDAGTVFEAQEDARTRLFKRLQYLS